MKPHSLQALFTNAVRGLHRQAWRKSVLGVLCAYRCPNGDRCAIGWSIPRGRYTRALEGHRVVDPAVRLAARAPGDQSDTLAELQRCHDEAAPGNPRHMAERFAAFGRKYGLRWPPSVPRP